jgi:hypothetical protein
MTFGGAAFANGLAFTFIITCDLMVEDAYHVNRGTATMNWEVRIINIFRAGPKT